eukprot:SAG11_NODE_32599_length_282_cov_0.896175_1_plen_73_part_10
MSLAIVDVLVVVVRAIIEDLGMVAVVDWSVFLVRKVRSECGAAATLFGLPSWERLNKDKIIPSPSQTITFMIR